MKLFSKNSIIYKTVYLLNSNQKMGLVKLFFLTIIGMFFEIFGLGVLIPAISILLDPNKIITFINKYPILIFLKNKPLNDILLMGLLFIITFYFIKVIYLSFLTWWQNKFSTKLSADIADHLFEGYLNMPYEFHLNTNSSILSRNVNNEVIQFSYITQSGILFATELSAIFGIGLVIIYIEPIGALFIIVILFLLVQLFHQSTKKKLKNLGEERMFNGGNQYKQMFQGFGSIKELLIYHKQKHFLSKFSFFNQKNSIVQAKVNTLNLLPRLYLEFFAIFILVGLIFLMIIQDKSADLLLPILGVFVAASFRMIPSVNRIMSCLQQLKFAESTINLFFSEFTIISKINNKSKNHSSLNISFEQFIEFKNICFRYSNSNSDVIKDVTFNVKKNESIGIIGTSGAGKSTLMDLMLGLIQPQSGDILCDNISIYGNIKSWQKNIGYVPQTIYLIDDTIEMNIAFGVDKDNIDQISLMNSIKASQLFDFIDSLPLKLDTIVGERGVMLSGGQRQRVGIARALYRNPSILILDEATSALDTETESNFIDAIKILKGQKTIFIIAHRLSTLENCDRIISLENGKTKK
jgi:ABC-type multidrug transport system fused ATPase/permease subunit